MARSLGRGRTPLPKPVPPKPRPKPVKKDISPSAIAAQTNAKRAQQIAKADALNKAKPKGPTPGL